MKSYRDKHTKERNRRRKFPLTIAMWYLMRRPDLSERKKEVGVVRTYQFKGKVRFYSNQILLEYGQIIKNIKKVNLQNKFYMWIILTHYLSGITWLKIESSVLQAGYFPLRCGWTTGVLHPILITATEQMQLLRAVLEVFYPAKSIVSLPRNTSREI